MQNLIIWLLLFAAYQTLTMATCPYACDCPDEPSTCRAGVSLVRDGCDCCKVCARQAGDECDDETRICDPHRRLFCDYSSSRSGDYGICRARSGKSCWYDGVLIASGAMFQPSCKERCWCIDGAKGCVPLCAHETRPPPRAAACRLQSVPGECCDRWVCDDRDGDDVDGGATEIVAAAPPSPLDPFWSTYVDDEFAAIGDDAAIGNGVRDGVVYDSDDGVDGDNELTTDDAPPSIFRRGRVGDNPAGGGGAMLKSSWHVDNIIPGDSHARRSPAATAFDVSTGDKRPTTTAGCDDSGGAAGRSTAWSACSKSCGVGISTRVAHGNGGACEPARESRLCEVRPCRRDTHLTLRFTAAGSKKRQCVRQKRSRKRVSMTYAGCTSLRKTRPRYCGACLPETGKCCTPRTTRTARMQFVCPSGSVISRNVMIVRSCHCHKNCAAAVAARWRSRANPKYSLRHDMHRPATPRV